MLLEASATSFTGLNLAHLPPSALGEVPIFYLGNFDLGLAPRKDASRSYVAFFLPERLSARFIQPATPG